MRLKVVGLWWEGWKDPDDKKVKVRGGRGQINMNNSNGQRAEQNIKERKSLS